MELTIEPRFKLKQTVYFMRNNRVKKSTITCINYPSVWINKNKKIQQTGFTYRVKSLTPKDYGNSGGFPECLLFATKKDLLKSL